jgi:hypothetical protein
MQGHARATPALLFFLLLNFIFLSLAKGFNQRGSYFY